MAYYVINGMPGCPDFCQVVYVCQYLEQHLPKFDYRKDEIPKENWGTFLYETNKKNDWYHQKSPLIWKEVARRGGKPYLIGGVSEFWEYVYDYYGLEAVLPKADLELLTKDNLDYYNMKQQAKSVSGYKINTITFGGINNPMIALIIPSMVKSIDPNHQRHLSFRLYDTSLDLGNVSDLIEAVEATSDMITDVQLVTTVHEALNDCDLYIEMDDEYMRGVAEPMDLWMARNQSYMLNLSDAINRFAKRNLIVILAGPGPICFNATVLVDVCTSIRPINVLAITADKAAAPTSIMARKYGLPLNELGAAPVWGLWMDPFVDMGAMLKRLDIYRPHQRAIRTNGGSTLPLGIVTSELHFINYIVGDVEDVLAQARVNERSMAENLTRPLTYAKAMATLKVVEMLLKGEPSDEIISLGVMSDGSFGFQHGLVASQPATFDGNTFTPFRNFPITKHSQVQIRQAAAALERVLSEHTFKIRCIPTSKAVML